MKKLSLFITTVCALALGACAETRSRRGDGGRESASEDLMNEIQQTESDIQKGYSLHYDLLAKDHLDAAETELSKAKERIKNHAPRTAVSNSLSSARAHFNEAARESDRLYSRMSGILEARNSALSVGVRNIPELSKKLKAADDDVRSEIYRISRNETRPDRWSRLQSAYLQLELEGIQDAKLHDVRAKINSAIKNGAQKNTPRLLAQTQRNLMTAENAIAADRHTPDSYAPAIQKVNNSAILLTEVLASTKRPEGVISEEAAKDLVLTNRDLRKLSERLQEASSESATQDMEISRQRARLKEADVKLSLDRAYEQARRELRSDQAEVYSQGDRLLIRMKGLEFPTGSANLPPSSLEILSKVGNIAHDLHPQHIIIEGHADSTGKAQFNRLLSLDRAQAVASFLETKGLDKDKIETVGRGYEKPVVTNKTKTGRAQNRRVDVIILPGTNPETSTEPKAKESL